MTRRESFQRKIVYLVMIACLLSLLYWLGAPSVSGTGGEKGSPGGKLARLRTELELNQSELGQIDPTSETIKLATFGLRGVASNVLWGKANRYKMKKDWTNLAASLKQLAKLQPNRVSVWIFQAHNISFNVSWEFDDFRERYRWVIKGIDFLKEGMKYNKGEPRLAWETGWYLRQKIGRSDERRQFRKLFREDDVFHSQPLPVHDLITEQDPRDNWLVAREWFLKAQDQVRARRKPMKGTAPMIFYSDAPMCLMAYAEDLERDGIFGERALRAWKLADEQWRLFGDRPIPTAREQNIQLNKLEFYEKEYQRLSRQLDALGPGVREQIRGEKETARAEKQRREKEAGKTPEYAPPIRVTNEEVAKQITGPNRKKAVALTLKAETARRAAVDLQRDRNILAYDYWQLLAKMEQTEEAIAARKLIYQGDQAYAEGDLEAAREAYRRGCASWASLLQNCEEEKRRREAARVLDSSTPDDVADIFVDDVRTVVRRYMIILDKLDDTFPEDFALRDFVHDRVNKASETVAARGMILKGDQAMAAADPKEPEESLRAALKSYEDAMVQWRKVLDEFPSLLLGSDPESLAEIDQTIRKYVDILRKLDEPFPANFILRDVLDATSQPRE